MRNTLYYGDNLGILREYIPAASVDLVYLDPPFNSNRSYNVLFKQASGQESEAQIQAFDDTWNWAGAAATYHELGTVTDGKVGEMIGALHTVLGENYHALKALTYTHRARWTPFTSPRPTTPGRRIGSTTMIMWRSAEGPPFNLQPISHRLRSQGNWR